MNIEWADKLRTIGKTYVVSAWLRRFTEKSELTWDRIETILKNTPEYSIIDKFNMALQQLARMTASPGSSSSFRHNIDYPLIYAHNSQEALFYMRELAELRYIGLEGGMIATVRTAGYGRLLELEQSGKQSTKAFVAMWFAPSMNAMYEQAIEPAIRDSGYISIRVDRTEHVNRIDDEIIGQIRRSRFMVADFTGHRAGVYFEAGMMQGLGRDVIWMCNKNELDQAHFDVRQFNFIDYQTVEEAKVRLLNRILRLEG